MATTDAPSAQTYGEAQEIFKAAVVNDAGLARTADDLISSRMPEAVKGRGFVDGVRQPNGTRKLAPTDDPKEILRDSMLAEDSLRKAVRNGVQNPSGIYKGMQPDIANQLGAMMQGHPQVAGMQSLVNDLQSALHDISGKNFTLTSPNATGLVPVDLAAPSKLLYPVFSPLRNKIPRTAGQGKSAEQKVMLAISGSGNHAAPPIRITHTELMGASNMANWPLALPSSGTQISENLNVPYRFWGLTESLSWLAQFQGQGFEDVAALASLVLLQQVMLAEEYADLFATSIAPTAPVIVSAKLRVAGSGEVGISGAGTNLYVTVTATNPFGETVMATPVAATGTYAHDGTQVVDVVLAGIPAGSTGVNVYAGAGASLPSRTGVFRVGSGVGGSKFTVQGALPVSGNPPVADTGTSASTDQEGIISVLSGNAADGSMYPTQWKGGYVNSGVGDTLNTRVLNTLCQQIFNGPDAYRASPSELIAEGSDIMRASEDIVANGADSAYRITIQQSEVGNIRDGAAVSEFQNPITKDVMRFLVHPWMTQGTAIAMSYTLPFGWSNVSNVLEKRVVQDYLSISWPVIDVTFRYSMFFVGSLLFNAPMYCGLLQGLQSKVGNGTSTPFA